MRNNYVLWILGVMSLGVGYLAGLMIHWRREIDKDIADNRVAIARLEAIQKEVDRNSRDIDRVEKRVSDMRESRLLDRRRKGDDMEHD